RAPAFAGTASSISHDFSTSLEKLLRVAKFRSVEKEKRDPARIERDREDGVRRAIRRTESDDQRVVIAVDQLDRARQPLAHLWRVLREKGGELFSGVKRV